MTIPATRPDARAAQSLTAIALRDMSAHCASRTVRASSLAVGLESDALRDLDLIVHLRIRVKKRDALYQSGARFDSLFAVHLGTFKTIVLAADGREQITGYHMAGDVFGADGIGDGAYACQAIALEDSEVCALNFGQLEQLARRVPQLQRNLYCLIATDVRRAQDMMFMLGSTRAEERLVHFLLNLAQRYQARGYSSSEFLLRMTREETASYLGLKLETVSRLFSRLQELGLLQVQGRMIKLLDVPALRQLVGEKDGGAADAPDAGPRRVTAKV
jgi:CRP/FNR family transcriptional regulator, anaerobic regulatory protein